MKKYRTLVAVAALVGTAATAQAQHSAKLPKLRRGETATEVNPELGPQAKITPDSARALVHKAVRHGTIMSEEIEQENGHLLYSYDVRVKGKSGISEVNIDALDGKILSVQHEGPGAEAGEKAQDEKDAAAKKAGAGTPATP